MSMLEVKTEVFEGPLDLLLHLIEKDDLDITAVSLVQVTDQYLAALRTASRLDLTALADFVAVAAKLLFLKSRALLPRSPGGPAEEEDREAEEIARDLTEQLAEYRRFKEAAAYLRDLDERQHRSYARVAPPPVDWLPSGLERVTLKRLTKAFLATLERLPPQAEPERLQRLLLSVGERRRQIVEALRRSRRLSFSSLLARSRTRLDVIMTFLAVLDLLKTGDLEVEQEGAFGEIVLSRPSKVASVTA
jgi:segregation and condensation protein A